MPGDVSGQLAGLKHLSPAQVREAWRTVTGKPLPLVSPALLRLALAWDIQARAYGGHSRATQQTLAQLATGKTRTRGTSPGMRLMREWNGILHVVTIDEEGAIRWQEKEWRSLSEVARAITGTRWSGPAFFALKQKVTA